MFAEEWLCILKDKNLQGREKTILTAILIFHSEFFEHNITYCKSINENTVTSILSITSSTHISYVIFLLFLKYTSSCTEVFFKKGVLRNFQKFTGKHQCQNFYFNKVAGIRPAALLK